MIQVKFYTEDDYEEMTDDRRRYLPEFFDEPEPEVLSWPEVFHSIYDKSQEPPFRDPESVAFLEKSGITFVDGDWYSVIKRESNVTFTGDGSYADTYKDIHMPLSALDDEYKFALAAIARTKQGKYIWAASSRRCDIIKNLSELSCDILLAVCKSHIDAVRCVGTVPGCKFINFPYQNGAIEVICKSGFYDSESDGCVKVPYGEWEHECLWKDADGVYYCDGWHVDQLLEYCWWRDIDNVIKYVDSCERARVYLAKPNQIYSLLQIGELIAGDEGAAVPIRFEYFSNMKNLKDKYDRGAITRGEYERDLKKLQSGSLYEKYLYYRDMFKVICHLPMIPKDRESGRLCIMIVDRNPDGSYMLITDKVHFRPHFCDAIDSMLYNDVAKYEKRVGLVVPGKRVHPLGVLLDSVRDISNAVYGFKVYKDSMEIFDSYEAVQVFGAALREAQTSGKCSGHSYVRRVIKI